MAQEWDSHVNTRFYGQDGSYAENTEEVEFKSGRKIYYLKNSTPSKTHALSLTVDDREKVDGKTEFQWFLYWYENTIKSGTLSFYLTDIIAKEGTREYRITEPPTWEGLGAKEIELQLEEA